MKTEWFDGRLAGEFALFQIEQDLVMMNPVSLVDSISGIQRHRGLELALRGKITKNLQAGFSTMLLDAEQADTGIAASDGKRLSMSQSTRSISGPCWTSRKCRASR